MREARRLRGARALLFERLTDLEPRHPEEEEPARVLDGDELRLSVRRELERLLNTRCVLTPEALEGRQRTTLEYGVPDFGHLQTRDTGARKLIAEEVRRAVVAYEPRLADCRRLSFAARPAARSGSPGLIMPQPSMKICEPICSDTTCELSALDPLCGAGIPCFSRR